MYPRNFEGGDRRSLDSVATLANALGVASDPFVSDRSRRLWEHVVQPLLEQQRLDPLRTAIDFVDIGGGTGALAGALCQHITGWSRQTGLAPRFHLTLVDLAQTALAPMLLSGDLNRHIEGITRAGMDYRSWLATRPASGPTRSVRFGLACKVFDMASQFVIRPFAEGQLPAPPAVPAWFVPKDRSPVYFLSQRGRDPEALPLSPLRFQVGDGHVFAQPARSGYFSALASVSGDQPLSEPHSVCLPVRVFNPGALLTSTGLSILGPLLQLVDYLLIEDADLRPEDLLAHIAQFHLTDLVVYDMTATMGLTGNNAYVLLKRTGSPPRLDVEPLL